LLKRKEKKAGPRRSSQKSFKQTAQKYATLEQRADAKLQAKKTGLKEEKKGNPHGTPCERSLPRHSTKTRKNYRANETKKG